MTYPTKLYEFSQNNTFGTFDEGVGHTVLVEASTPEEANERALTAGVYFNGCASGRDCACCGDRWSTTYAEPLPFERSLSVSTLEAYLRENGSRSRLRVVYADGEQVVYSRGADGVVRKLQPARGTSPGGVPVAPADAWTLPGDEPS